MFRSLEPSAGLQDSDTLPTQLCHMRVTAVILPPRLTARFCASGKRWLSVAGLARWRDGALAGQKSHLPCNPVLTAREAR